MKHKILQEFLNSDSKRVLENELEHYFNIGWLKGMKREYCKNKKN